MFEFDAGKLVIIGIVALIVIGPKELPRVLRQAGQAMAKLRHMAAEFQSQFMEAMHEAELSDLKEEAAKLAASTKIDAAFNPIAELRSELTRAIDGAGTATATTPGRELAATGEPPGRDQARNSILAPEAFDGRDGIGVPVPEITTEAEKSAQAARVLAPGSDAAEEPVPTGGGGQDRESDLPLEQAPPVSRT